VYALCKLHSWNTYRPQHIFRAGCWLHFERLSFTSVRIYCGVSRQISCLRRLEQDDEVARVRTGQDLLQAQCKKDAGGSHTPKCARHKMHLAGSTAPHASPPP
jgi:hypothetical protein